MRLLCADVIVADKGYDSECIRDQMVENAFARLKHYRAVAFRYDKLKRNYEAVVAMACVVQWLKRQQPPVFDNLEHLTVQRWGMQR